MLTKDPKTEHKRRVAPATAKRQPRARPPELPKLVKPDGAGPAGLPSQTSFEAITATLTANTLTAITERWLADEIARANAFARADANVLRAVNDLLPKLMHAYGRPARDEADMRSQHVVALLAIAHFLSDVGPDYLAHFANQFAMLAQTLKDLDNGIRARAPILNPPKARRSDQTMVWLARAHVALAVETMRWCGHNRKSAAKWAAQRHPELEQLITERGFNLDRGKSLETAIMSWCRAFSRNKVTNPYAAAHYSVGLDRLEAWAPNCDQIEAEADSLLQEAVRLAAEFRRNKSGE